MNRGDVAEARPLQAFDELKCFADILCVDRSGRDYSEKEETVSVTLVISVVR